jgi:hypothetical protein
MHTEKREDPLVELGYEVRDLNTVAIRNSVIAFFVFAIGSAILGFVCYRLMNPSVFENPQQASSRMVPAPPNPLIQSNIGAKTDIMDIRQHETQVLTGPIGWTDANKSHLHIPIDMAMEIIAKRGVTPTGASVPAVSTGHTPNPEIGEKPATPNTTPSRDIQLNLGTGAKPLPPGSFGKPPAFAQHSPASRMANGPIHKKN